MRWAAAGVVGVLLVAFLTVGLIGGKFRRCTTTKVTKPSVTKSVMEGMPPTSSLEITGGGVEEQEVCRPLDVAAAIPFFVALGLLLLPDIRKISLAGVFDVEFKAVSERLESQERQLQAQAQLLNHLEQRITVSQSLTQAVIPRDTGEAIADAVASTLTAHIARGMEQSRSPDSLISIETIEPELLGKVKPPQEPGAVT